MYPSVLPHPQNDQIRLCALTGCIQFVSFFRGKWMQIKLSAQVFFFGTKFGWESLTILYSWWSLCSRPAHTTPDRLIRSHENLFPARVFDKKRYRYQSKVLVTRAFFRIYFKRKDIWERECTKNHLPKERNRLIPPPFPPPPPKEKKKKKTLKLEKRKSGSFG